MKFKRQTHIDTIEQFRIPCNLKQILTFGTLYFIQDGGVILLMKCSKKK